MQKITKQIMAEMRLRSPDIVSQSQNPQQNLISDFLMTIDKLVDDDNDFQQPQ